MIMKRIFVGFIFFLFAGLAQAQVKMEIIGMEIARNVRDTVGSTEKYDPFLPTMLMMSWDDFPRIKINMNIINTGIKDFRFYEGDESYALFDAEYRFKRKWRKEKCSWINRDEGVIRPGETLEVFLAFQLPESFPKENYMEAFFDILPTLRIKLTKMEDEKELWTIFSEPIDWGRISVRNTENDLII